MEKKIFVKNQLAEIVNAYENQNNNNNNNNRNNNKNQENEFFSSEDSEGEYITPSILSRRRSLLRKGIRKKSIEVDSNNIDILPDKREKNLNSMIQLRRKHILKHNKLKNKKVGWNLVYDLLFCDYFNEMKSKKENFGDEENEILFNMQEIQLRIKKIINKIKYKEKNKKNDFINFETPSNLNKEITFPEPNWEDKSFYSIINELKIDDKERSNYLPIFIKTFQNFQDYNKENYEQENKNNDKNYSKQMIRYNPKKSSSSLLPKNDHFPIKKQSNNAKRMSVTLKPNLNQMLNFNLINNNNEHNSGNNVIYNDLNNIEDLKINKNINKFYSPPRASIKRKSNKKIISIKNKMFNINVNYDDKNYFDDNINKFKYGEKYDLINKNKNFAEYLIRNYSNYDEDITNIQNNFLVYDIELTKNEKIFKNKSNELIKHFYDLHIENTEIGNKNVLLPERVIKNKKKIDEFINKFNEVMKIK